MSERLFSKCWSILPIGLILLYATLFGNGYLSDSEPNSGRNRQWSTDEYRSVLKNVNREGLVDYEGLKENRCDLDHFVQRMATLLETEFRNWSEEEQIAFWLNAYNSLTLKAIIDHYPIEPSFFGSLRFPKNSIRQIPGVWDELEFNVMGRPRTLDQIEHEILRRQFYEPRIHAALVCAAKGCPVLRNEPYVGALLDKQLDEQASLFFADPQKFRIDRQTKTVYFSKILDWYGGDFIKASGGSRDFPGRSDEVRAILDFASSFVSPEDSMYLRNSKYKIRFLDYDWSLNHQ